MEDKIIAIYCLCADLLKALHHPENPQHHMTDAEVMPTALVAALFLAGTFERARGLLGTPHDIPAMLSKSRYKRRLHRLTALFGSLFALLGQTWQALNPESVYVIDSLPIAGCDNYRIPRAKLYQQEALRGYVASKKRYFYGLKLHLLVTQAGQPVEFFLTPGACGAVTALKQFAFDLPEGSLVYGDKAYHDYAFEDLLSDAAHIRLLPIRKRNSKRALPPYVAFVQHYQRKMIETAGSLINRLLPKSIHAVTSQGFELKVALFVVAYSINCSFALS